METAQLGRFTRKERRKLLFQWSVVSIVSIIFKHLLSGCHDLPDNLNEMWNLNIFFPIQQVFLHMGKQAVERHTP